MAGVLADITTAAHVLALLYIGLGGFFAWHWPKSIFIHVFFAAWGFIVLIFPIPCPLTSLEDYFRHLQGLGSLPGGFNEYYIYDQMIPRELLPAVAVAAIILLVTSYVGAYTRWKDRQAGSERHADRIKMG